METYYKETGRKININVCISLYNFFHLEKILDENQFTEKDQIDKINLEKLGQRKKNIIKSLVKFMSSKKEHFKFQVIYVSEINILIFKSLISINPNSSTN